MNVGTGLRDDASTSLCSGLRDDLARLWLFASRGVTVQQGAMRREDVQDCSTDKTS